MSLEILAEGSCCHAIGLCSGRAQGRRAETSIICFLASFVPPGLFLPRLKNLKVASETVLFKAGDKDENTQGHVSVTGCGSCL